MAGNPVAQKNLAALNDFHQAALNSGLADTSPEYFSFMEQQLAALHSQQPAANGQHLIQEMQQRAAPAQPAPQPRQRTNIVSAPVSREVPTASGSRDGGKINLSVQQKEAAKIAGVSEVEYAKQLAEIQRHAGQRRI